MTPEEKRILENSRDAVLIKRHKEGDKKAFAELTELHRKGMIAYVAKQLRDPKEAEDVVQELFLILLEAINNGAYVEEGVFGGWLRKTAFHYVWHKERDNKLITERLETEDLETLNIAEEPEEENELIGILPEAVNDLQEEKEKL